VPVADLIGRAEHPAIIVQLDGGDGASGSWPFQAEQPEQDPRRIAVDQAVHQSDEEGGADD
jgi:hypothetical protein